MDNTVQHPPTATPAVGPASHSSSQFIALTLGSIGIVYGDIGTSPLYAFREAVVAATHDGQLTRDIVLGVLSLILWALIIVVTLKYVLILLRANNNGEGGTLSLAALATRALRQPDRVLAVLAELAPMGSVGPITLNEVLLVLEGMLLEVATTFGALSPCS